MRVKFAALVSKQALEARRDPALAVAVIERLSSALGMMISLAAGGDAKAIDKLAAGIEAYVLEESTRTAGLFSALRKIAP